MLDLFNYEFMNEIKQELTDIAVCTLIVTTVAWVAVVGLTLCVVLNIRNKVAKILGKEEIEI